ncbi:hypothetical protein [Sinomonas gamaensis]|uniref:hypothetical protein n=1 Tax=Sinomonas gamaensis TaxID=2565624 RepID=UPI00110877AB|nr:hypothetical protein [Sinomonas gamaensis]
MALLDLRWKDRDPQDVVWGLVVGSGLAGFAMVFLTIWTNEQRWGASALWMFAVCFFFYCCLRYIRNGKK